MQTSLVKKCVAEFIGTFALIFIGVGAIANHTGLTGNAVLLAVALGPFTGAAMNPARTFGPAVIGGLWDNHFVCWVGRLLGGGLAGLIYSRFLLKQP